MCLKELETKGGTAAVEREVSRKDSNGQTPLFYAAREGNVELA